MLLERLDGLDEAKLQKLCDERCPESGTLEFKRALPSTGDKEKDKYEFLKDVCALANSEGGDLVYGIAEKDGTAKALTPISVDAPDAAMRRLGQILDAGLEPRLPGFQFHPVAVTGGYILVLRVPASFDGPHRFLSNSQSKFVMRSGTHTLELSYAQLRNAFDRTATLADRARRFRDDRLQVIIDRKTWRPMRPGPICVVHLIPLSSMSGRKTIDVQALNNNFGQFTFPEWGGGSRTLNLDGLVVHPGIRNDEGMQSFNQIFRTGAIEGLRGAGYIKENRHLIGSSTTSAFFRDAIVRFVGAAKSSNFSGPAVVSAALLFVDDYELELSPEISGYVTATADREHLVLPEVWLDSLESVADFDAIARPMLDVLWQSFGLDRCLEYNQQGVWSSRMYR